VVLDGHMLHLELVAGVPGTGYAHGLRAEDVDLEEVAGCQLLMPGLVPSPLCFAWFYQSSPFINLDGSYCNTIDTAYSSYSTDDILWQGYLANNIIQFNLLAILTQNQIPLRYTPEFSILPHYPPGTPRPLSKSNPTDGSAVAWGRTNPDCLP